jgi:hypothetical protein
MAEPGAESRGKVVDQLLFGRFQPVGFDKSPIAIVQTPSIVRAEEAVATIPAEQFELWVATDLDDFGIKQS